MPDAIKLFKLYRKKDINLNFGISENHSKLPFYCFDEPALNGFSKDLSEKRHQNSRYKITHTIDIETRPLSYVIDRYLPAGQQIDFLTVDVEGLDLQVLQSNNWDKYRPKFILIENDLDVDHTNQSEVYNLLKTEGYKFVAKTMRTLFFRLN